MSFPKMNEMVDAIKADIGNPMDSVTSPVGDQASEAVKETSAPAQTPDQTAPAPTPQEQAVLDLKELVKDKKFKFDDKEYTLEDLKKSIMRDKDYRQKTQEISGFKKEYETLKSDSQYWGALPGDVDRVKNDPSLVSKFKEVYPEKFHGYVAEYETQQPLTEARIRQLVSESITPVVQPLQESITDQNAKSIVAQMESWDSELGSKYKEADIKHVYTILQEAKAAKIPVTKELWEQAWKQSHDLLDARITARATERFKEKATLNQAGKDTKSGGATPGQAPEKVGLKDASKRLAEFLQSANQ